MVTKRQPTSSFDRLLYQTERYPSLERLQLYRNMYLGAGAACLVLVVSVCSVDSLTIWLERSLAASAVSMPIWLSLAGLFETYIMLGPKSYPHKRTPFARGIIGFLMIAAGVALCSSIGLLLYNSRPWIAYLFAVTIGVSVAAAVIFTRNLADWYYGSESNEDDAGGA